MVEGRLARQFLAIGKLEPVGEQFQVEVRYVRVKQLRRFWSNLVDVIEVTGVRHHNVNALAQQPVLERTHWVSGIGEGGDADVRIVPGDDRSRDCLDVGGRHGSGRCYGVIRRRAGGEVVEGEDPA